VVGPSYRCLGEDCKLPQWGTRHIPGGKRIFLLKNEFDAVGFTSLLRSTNKNLGQGAKTTVTNPTTTGSFVPEGTVKMHAWLNPVVIPCYACVPVLVLSCVAARLTVLLCVCASAFDIGQIKNYFTLLYFMPCLWLLLSQKRVERARDGHGGRGRRARIQDDRRPALWTLLKRRLISFIITGFNTLCMSRPNGCTVSACFV